MILSLKQYYTNTNCDSWSPPHIINNCHIQHCYVVYDISNQFLYYIAIQYNHPLYLPNGYIYKKKVLYIHDILQCYPLPINF